jgi:hypothetical protein
VSHSAAGMDLYRSALRVFACTLRCCRCAADSNVCVCRPNPLLSLLRGARAPACVRALSRAGRSSRRLSSRLSTR